MDFTNSIHKELYHRFINLHIWMIYQVMKLFLKLYPYGILSIEKMVVRLIMVTSIKYF